jgi:MFS family permease
MIIAAATIYGLGKTFLWPTMLGVVGERFPKGGALVMGAMGGVGMLSAGLLGGPGIGYEQDYYASAQLQEKSLPTYERYVSDEKNSFLMFPAISGLDGAKVGVLTDNGKDLARRLELAKADNREPDKETIALEQWWQTAKEYEGTDKPEVDSANLFGGQMALKWTALVPLTMAVGYLLLVLYFAATGGYKAVHLDEEPVGPAEY